MKLLKQGPRPFVPSNSYYNRLGPGVVPNVDAYGNVTSVSVAGGTTDGSGNPITWTGPAAYDLTVPGTCPLSGTYRLYCEGAGIYSLVRCGDDQGCGGGGPARG